METTRIAKDNEFVAQFGGPTFIQTQLKNFSNNAFTISFRMRGIGRGTALFLGELSDGNQFNAIGVPLEIRIDGNVSVRFGNFVEVTFPNLQFSNANYHYVAVRFAKAKNDTENKKKEIGIFIDGNFQTKEVPFINQQNQPLQVVQNRRLLINTYPNNQSIDNGSTNYELFEGKIMDLRVWNRDLPVDKIIADANTTVTGNEKDLCLALPLDYKNYDPKTKKYQDLTNNSIAETITIARDSAFGTLFSYNLPLNLRTVEFWILCGDDSMNAPILSYGNEPISGDRPNEQLFPWTISNPSNLNINGNSTNINVADGKWHHVAIISGFLQPNTTAVDKVYIDGDLKITKNSINFNQVSGRKLVFGASKTDDSPNMMFKGLMKRFFIWDGARTDQQIKDSFNSTELNGGNVSIQNGSFSRTYQDVLPSPNGKFPIIEVPVLITENELMLNHKHAIEQHNFISFKTLQSADGHALFFGIDNNFQFTLSKETPQSEAGWILRKLNNSLPIDQTKDIKAISFDVIQDLYSLKIDLVVGVIINGVGQLFYSQNNDVKVSNWASEIQWQGIPNDNNTMQNPSFSKIYLYAEGDSNKFIVADINKPNRTDKSILRYNIDPIAPIKWQLQTSDVVLQEDQILSKIGRQSPNQAIGIYTMIKATNPSPDGIFRNSIYFTPLFTPLNTQTQKVNQECSTFATIRNENGGTTLVVVAPKTLNYICFQSPENQNSAFRNTADFSHPMFSNIQSIQVETCLTPTSNRDTMLYAINQTDATNQLGDVFRMRCPQGKEKDPTAWLKPTPLQRNVSQFSAYCNLKTNQSIIFTKTKENNAEIITKIKQDKATKIWQKRAIVYGGRQVSGDIKEFYSFTTHIKALNFDGFPMKNPPIINITSESYASLYIDNNYYILSPTNPLQFPVDSLGSLTIVQETQSLSAAKYNLVIVGQSDVVSINPMDKIVDKFRTIQNLNDLNKIVLPNTNGRKLVPDSVNNDKKQSLVNGIKQLTGIADTFPKTGKNQNRSIPSTRPLDFWGLTFDGENWQEHQNPSSFGRVGRRSDAGDDSIANATIILAEDLFSWLKHSVEKVIKMGVHLFEGAYHFLVKIGEELFRFVIDSVNTVVHAVEFLFNKVSVAFGDLVQWVGFLFNWKDILTTHRVMKNIILKYAASIPENLNTAKTQVDTIIQSYIDNITKLSTLANTPNKIPAFPDTPSDSANQANGIPQLQSPQSSYGTHHFKNNITKANMQPVAEVSATTVFENLFAVLADDVIDNVNGILADLRTNIIDNFSHLSLSQIINEILLLTEKYALKSVKQIWDAIVDVIIQLSNNIVAILTEPIEIPVLTWLYKKIVNEDNPASPSDFTLLDLACLIAAIPSNIAFKAATSSGKSLFPADAPLTQALIQADSWQAVKTAFQNATPLNSSRTQRDTNQKSVGVTALKSLMVAASISALIGGIIQVFADIAITTAAKVVPNIGDIQDKDESSALLPQPFDKKKYLKLAAIGNTLYLAPDFVQPFSMLNDIPLTRHDYWVNTGLAIISFGKGFIDIRLKSGDNAFKSDILDGIINFGWFDPVVANIVYTTQDPNYGKPTDVAILTLNSIANSAFNIGGILVPVRAFESKKAAPISVQQITQGVQYASMLSYGVLITAASIVDLVAYEKQ